MPEKIEPWEIIPNTNNEREFPFQNFTPGLAMEMEKYKKIFISLAFFKKFMHVSREMGKKFNPSNPF
ncbi:MAG: hypothetical protein RQ739_00720 [Desulfotignum sp.]|nr:hypothetical protein [Desulfotignum sp.]